MPNLFMRFPGGKSKALTLSYDDGVEQDEKLISIMVKYGLKGTFNLNSGLYPPEDVKYPAGQIHRRMPKSRVSALYTKNGMEVAIHGYTHPFLEQLPVNVCMEEIIKDRRCLEEQFGVFVRGMAYPFGTYNDTVVDIIKNAGICYSRTVISSHNFNIPTDWLRLPATCHHNDPELMNLADRFLEDVKGRGPQLFYLWGHAYEFEDRNNWNVIEDFAEKMSGNDDIYYATNIEIYDYVKAYEALIFDVGMTKCYNPTITDIWFNWDNKPYCVKKGETISLA